MGVGVVITSNRTVDVKPGRTVPPMEVSVALREQRWSILL